MECIGLDVYKIKVRVK